MIELNDTQRALADRMFHNIAREYKGDMRGALAYARETALLHSEMIAAGVSHDHTALAIYSNIADRFERMLGED